MSVRPGPGLSSDALAQLYKKTKGELIRRLGSLLGNKAEAEEVAQDAWVIVWNHREKITTNAEGFLFITARNLASKRRASRANKPMLDLEMSEHEHPPDVLTPERVLASRQELDHVQQAFFNLSPTMQQIVMATVEGDGQVEIANRLGISQAKVSRHLAKAMKLLRIPPKLQEALTPLDTETTSRRDADALQPEDDAEAPPPA